MNRADAWKLLVNVARQWPGSVIVDAGGIDLWTAALSDMTPADAALALVRHTETSPHAPKPADLWAAHRALAGDPHARPRPEIARPALAVAGPREAPDVAHGELAKMRALLGEASPYNGRRR